MSESEDCKMGVNNLSKVFGPTLIGYSSSDPEPMQIMAETGKQAKVGSELTHWGLDKMAAILQMIFSKAFSLMKMFVFGCKFHLNFVPNGQTDNKSAKLVWVMAGADKSLLNQW